MYRVLSTVFVRTFGTVESVHQDFAVSSEHACDKGTSVKGSFLRGLLGNEDERAIRHHNRPLLPCFCITPFRFVVVFGVCCFGLMQ
jgi:hypothetical protein